MCGLKFIFHVRPELVADKKVVDPVVMAAVWDYILNALLC